MQFLKILLSLLFAFLSISTAFAQDSALVSLSVGNKYVYHYNYHYHGGHVGSGYSFTNEIVDDTLINSKEFYIVNQSGYIDTTWFPFIANSDFLIEQEFLMYSDSTSFGLFSFDLDSILVFDKEVDTVFARSFNDLDVGSSRSTTIFDKEVEYRGIWSYDYDIYQHDYNAIEIYNLIGLGGFVNNLGGAGGNRISLEAAIINGKEYGNLNLVSNEPEMISDKDFSLSQNYPNPFNPSTNIEVAIPNPSSLKLEVFTSSGKKIATIFDGHKNSGKYTFRFDASHFSSGIYFYKVTIDGRVSTKKMTLIK